MCSRTANLHMRATSISTGVRLTLSFLIGSSCRFSETATEKSSRRAASHSYSRLVDFFVLFRNETSDQSCNVCEDPGNSHRHLDVSSRQALDACAVEFAALPADQSRSEAKVVAKAHLRELAASNELVGEGDQSSLRSMEGEPASLELRRVA